MLQEFGQDRAELAREETRVKLAQELLSSGILTELEETIGRMVVPPSQTHVQGNSRWGYQINILPVESPAAIALLVSRKPYAHSQDDAYSSEGGILQYDELGLLRIFVGKDLGRVEVFKDGHLNPEAQRMVHQLLEY